MGDARALAGAHAGMLQARCTAIRAGEGFEEFKGFKEFELLRAGTSKFFTHKAAVHPLSAMDSKSVDARLGSTGRLTRDSRSAPMCSCGSYLRVRSASYPRRVPWSVLVHRSEIPRRRFRDGLPADRHERRWHSR
jgi:hypothetical protein